MPVVKATLKCKRELISTVKAKKSRKEEHLENAKKSNNVVSSRRRNSRNNASQLLEYRRRRLRTLRLKRWAVHVNRSKSCSPMRSNCHGPTLRSSSIQNVKGLDESYVVNLKLLGEGLRRCTKCEGGPFSLDDIIKPPVRVGLGVVLYVQCRNCKAESSIRPYYSHRTGRRGPEAVTLNSRAALAMLHTGQGHAHLKADLSVLGIGSLTSRSYKKREREVGVAVESVCKESCTKSKEMERVECGKVDSDGDALVSVSYDGA